MGSYYRIVRAYDLIWPFRYEVQSGTYAHGWQYEEITASKWGAKREVKRLKRSEKPGQVVWEEN